MTHIHPAKRKETGVYFVNGKGISLNQWRQGQRFGLTPQETRDFERYIKEYKLGLN